MKKSSKKKKSPKSVKYFVPLFEGTLRVRQNPPLGSTYPASAQILMNHFMGGTVRRSTLSFSMNLLPPTVNGMYTHTRFATRLSEETLIFRDMASIAIGSQKFHFKTGGIVAGMIFIESPHWITLKHTLREMDLDNRIKPLFDAVKHALGLADETNWEFHVYKVQSKNTRTTVHLFDLGDIVDFYS